MIKMLGFILLMVKTYYIDKNGVVSYGVQDNVICSNNKINEDSIEKILLEGNIDFWKKLKIK